MHFFRSARKSNMVLVMSINTERKETSNRALIEEWRSLHPEFTDEEFEEALVELRAYLRLAWTVYKAQHSDLNLPDSL
jgi:hypothetical protein